MVLDASIYSEGRQGIEKQQENQDGGYSWRSNAAHAGKNHRNIQVV